MSDAHAFEQALTANPDDFAGWCAYADYLVEQDDPRGAFMQTQLALEDEGRSKEGRDALKQREAELLAEHERDWLGPLAGYLPDGSPRRSEPPMILYLARGFLAEVRVLFLTPHFLRTLAASPA